MKGRGMKRVETRFSGFGGQGVILAAYIVGKAVAVFESQHATLNQSFGPEARGSACSAQVVLSDEPVSYPYVRQTDVLVSMSQDAFRSFVSEVREGGTILVDEDLVSTTEVAGRTLLAVPATRMAEALGRRIIANMVMVGFFTATTGLAHEDSVREAIKTSVPSGTEKLNLEAFEQGLAYGKSLLAGSGMEVQA
jgi:2-oxoglutarate ferredoxin oxidoreductase subunit gamma